MQRPLSAVLFLLILSACGKPLPTLDGVNLDKWKEDKNACSGDRQKMEQSLAAEVSKLRGLSEMDIVKMLGRPDENELYKRNQKFYSYYVTPGPDCPDHQETPRKLVVRFNAMGYAQLVSVGDSGQ